jgi:YD repeat-containing protein
MHLLLRLLTIAFAGIVPAIAYTQTYITINPPEYKTTDGAGVNVMALLPHHIQKTTSIGPPGIGIQHTLKFEQEANRSNIWAIDSHYMYIWTYRVPRCPDEPPGNLEYSGGCSEIVVKTGYSEERFLPNGGAYIPKFDNGNTLTQTGDGTFIYTTKDGTRYRADPTHPASGNDVYTWLPCATTKNCARVIDITFPDGRIITFGFEQSYYGAAGAIGSQLRLSTVTQSNGYQLLYEYSPGSPGGIAGITAINSTVDYCAPGQPCAFTRAWPKATITGYQSIDTEQGLSIGASQDLVVTDKAGDITRYRNTGIQISMSRRCTRITAVKSPSSASSDTIAYTYTEYLFRYSNVLTGEFSSFVIRNCVIGGATSEAGSYGYNVTKHAGIESQYQDPYHPANNQWSSGSTGPAGQTVGTSYIGQSNWTSLPAGLQSWGASTAGGATFFANRMTNSSDLDGRYFTYGYDARGNVVERRQTAAYGSGQPDLIHTASYDASCTYPVKCNKPNWVRDAKGNQTDYEYDIVHGGMLKETSPPDVSGIRAQKRYSYVQRHAWVKNASGGYSPSASPIWVLNQVSFCRVGAAAASGVGCALGSSDEVITTYDYGPNSGPNNLLLRGQTVTADGQSLRTCYAYDALGNKISETTPRAGLTTCS